MIPRYPTIGTYLSERPLIVTIYLNGESAHL